MPNDPGFPGNTGITLAGTKYTQTYLNRIQAPQAWEYLQSCGKTPTAAVTAVLDSGVDASHLDLNGRLLPGQSFQGTPETTDETGHGTAVAGLIGASTNNAIGLAGVTWSGRNLVPIKIIDGTGGTTTAKLTQGLNAALARGAKVINMSVGTPGNPGDAALDAALNTAARSAVLIAAAGNTSNEGVYYPPAIRTSSLSVPSEHGTTFWRATAPVRTIRLKEVLTWSLLVAREGTLPRSYG
ncbi:S8 family serine peptidase [Deinococcus malanensis]|uniref:S8 family serine peptidase n=1 Tax=Deinococcus malanensis TaxID=1706855 RepID=UPI003637B3C3